MASLAASSSRRSDGLRVSAQRGARGSVAPIRSPALPDCRPARCTARRWLWRRRCWRRWLLGPARAFLFVGGAAADGGGQVVGKDLEQAMRSHKDIAKDAAPFMRKATKYYETIATQLCSCTACLDVFACSLDQVGLAEMKVCAEKTGGMVVLAESFANTVFKTSFRSRTCAPRPRRPRAMFANEGA